ncbi:DICT sensory domain-containing protein [Haladaptatus sp.]|uniref:DICT sensory domain-containing protein n=1 Tax=Haladaptatus sp. TaxID=1973141 RepID=UPI003C363EE0
MSEGEGAELPMNFREAIDAVERERKTLVVYGGDSNTDLAEQFETKNVTVKYKRLRSVGPNEFLVIRDEDGFQGAIGLTALREFLTPPVLVPWHDDFDPSSFRDLRTLLDETLFTSFDRRQMLATSREIEDRAWRIAVGSLHVGFQAFSAFQDQMDLYRRLALETNLDIHIYGRADWQPPRIPNTTFCARTAGEIGQVWFLVYDGGGDDDQKCALVAEERDDGEFFGFWTYNPTTVDELLDHLVETYG